LANENLSYREFFEKLASITNSRPAMIPVPTIILYLAGLTGNFFRLMGFKTMISLANMKILCSKGFYSNQKSKNKLGIKFRSTGQAIQDTIEWFKEKGMI
jgi:nucleoside-diphosphate-sugar epimerase